MRGPVAGVDLRQQQAPLAADEHVQNGLIQINQCPLQSWYKFTLELQVSLLNARVARMTKPGPYIVAIGGAAGGIDALIELLALLPPNLPAMVLATIHRRVYVESRLKDVLARHSHMRVTIPDDGERLTAGTCYIGHPSSHLTIGPGLRARFIADGFYRANNIDALFTSAARHDGENVIGVILSGLGSDGTLGLIAIKGQGGKALVQSPSEALWDEMPLSAIGQNERIDFVGTIKNIAQEICRLIVQPYDQFASGAQDNEDEIIERV